MISGLGEQHLNIICAKLESKFGASMALKEPKIPYREAIKSKVRAEGKHKKQSGGHGQYGHVFIEFEPVISDTLVFEEKSLAEQFPKLFLPLKKELQTL